MENFLPLSGYILAAIVFVFLLTAWRRVSAQGALLRDAANRFQMGKAAYQKLQGENKTLSEQDLLRRETVSNLEKNLDEARERFSQFKSEIEKTKGEYEDELATLRLKIEHFQEEHRALITQLADVEHVKNQALRELQTINLEGELRLKAEVQQWKTRFAESEKRAQELERELKKTQVILKDADPRENVKHRRKVSEMERLYQSMKGLREMAEERNQNLEVAARKLASHITGHPDTLADGRPAPLGPLVGEALEKIGATLVLESPEDHRLETEY